MKSPAALPSSSRTMTFVPGYSFSICPATAYASSPMIPGGHPVMTAKHLLPAAACFLITSCSPSAPPKIIAFSSIYVQAASGSSYVLATSYPRSLAPLAQLLSSCMVKWAQLFGECRMVVSPSTEVHTDDAPENAHPFRGSPNSTFREA